MVYSFTNHLQNKAHDKTAHHVAKTLFPNNDCEKAQEVISRWENYKPTPLVELTDIAAAAGVKNLYYKDEPGRFGLGSFKALGGAYAVQYLADNMKG